MITIFFLFFFFFFNDTATTEIYTLSLHDALPICCRLTCSGASVMPMLGRVLFSKRMRRGTTRLTSSTGMAKPMPAELPERSEEHTSELQSQSNLVCRLLLEKKKKKIHI